MSRVLLFFITACEWNSGAPKSDASSRLDGRHLVDARVHEDHVVLNEIALSPPGGEFIELKNPTNRTIDLSSYYLADDGNYWALPVGAPILALSDFIVQFPASASIAPGAIITVAIGTAATFTTTYAKAPTYSIAETMVKTAVPGTPTLTDSGEIIALFAWDGAGDLVKDVDLMIAGNATPQNGLVSKSETMQGAGKYATDAETIAPQATAPASGTSTKRIAAEAGSETQDGTGNGLSGDDETSEDTSATWDSTFTAPTPGS